VTDQILFYLFDNLQVVFLVPLVVVGVLGVLSWQGVLKQSFRDAVYIGACLSLAMVYSLIFFLGGDRWFTYIIIVPQVVPLWVMGVIALILKMKNASYRTPSLWCALAVGMVGHAWTSYLVAGFGYDAR
jgi:predicted lysophospholipase L1 biosynthesis ABC-type transport system permease subunit